MDNVTLSNKYRIAHQIADGYPNGKGQACHAYVDAVEAAEEARSTGYGFAEADYTRRQAHDRAAAKMGVSRYVVALLLGLAIFACATSGVLGQIISVLGK